MRHHRGGYLHAVDTAHISGRDEAPQVADHAAAQGDQQRLAVRPAFEKLGGDAFHHLESFRSLSRRHKDAVRLLEAAISKECIGPPIPQPPLRQHEDLGVMRQRKPAQRAPGAAANHHVISRFLRGDPKALRGSTSAVSRPLTVALCPWSVTLRDDQNDVSRGLGVDDT